MAMVAALRSFGQVTEMTSYNIKGAPFPYSANPAKQLRRRQEPELPEALDKDLRTLAVRVNGFLYHGDRLEAVIDTIKALRADPDLAARLLGLERQRHIVDAAENWARACNDARRTGLVGLSTFHMAAEELYSLVVAPDGEEDDTYGSDL